MIPGIEEYVRRFFVNSDDIDFDFLDGHRIVHAHNNILRYTKIKVNGQLYDIDRFEEDGTIICVNENVK